MTKKIIRGIALSNTGDVCGVKQWIWISLTILWITARVEASVFWKLRNQLPREERVYTTPPDVLTTPTSPFFKATIRTTENKALYPNLREIHRYCDGQCFYAGDPVTPGGPPCDVTKFECEMVASVAMHSSDTDGEMYCDFFGTDPIKESFCYNSEAQKRYRAKSGKPDRFFTVTLNRMLGSPETYGRKTEFVAISFVKNGAPSAPPPRELHEDDIWYVCIADETHRSRVSMWTRVSDAIDISTKEPVFKAFRIISTKPHLESGMGVVFSKVTFDEDTVSMGCQFVIQESNMTLDYIPVSNAALFGHADHFPVTVKLASGYVQRDEENDEVVRPFYTKNAATKVFTGSEIKPYNTLDFTASKLGVNLLLASPTLADDLDIEEKNQKAIADILEKCDDPKSYPDLYIACYPPNDQLNCVHTGRCPVMFIVEVPKSNTAFDDVTAHVYSSIPDDRSYRKVVRPLGYASVGFSDNAFMGRDLVISCVANGLREIGSYVSLNFGRANIYPGQVDYNHMISNQKSYSSAEKNQILCSFDMKTKIVVNMFRYEPTLLASVASGIKEKLEFDFKVKPVYLLLAAGNRNYPGGTIVYHDYRQALKELFSKELFLKKATASELLMNEKIICFLLIFIYFAV
ncbi:hypothetical protein Ocin01_01314 [Orchesella cincta]|uniref:Uncharacterized protein n=1 Tax=Orchesella cincta TaxID=48709 RepID=A0A1D2NJ97_ORCCI|nr:hypothetical protein Ocin01_01314 [Orchesella cincta]